MFKAPVKTSKEVSGYDLLGLTLDVEKLEAYFRSRLH